MQARVPSAGTGRSSERPPEQSPGWQRGARGAALAALLLCTLPSQAGISATSTGLCAADRPMSAAVQDRRLRLAARVRQELEASGRTVALVARSGLDLERFGQRYSHAGVSLRASPNTRWSVRQLYYACDEGQPRIFDQGLAGFLLAADEQPEARLTLLLLPAQASAALEAAALDRRQALQLLAARYSANAYAFSTRYQNCNQWVAELLAAAWGSWDNRDKEGERRAAPADGPGDPLDATAALLPTRAQAQDWLRARGYEPHRFESSPWLYLLSAFVPLLHFDDHPEADREAAVYRVSMPESVEAFVHRQVPGTERVEFCQDERRIVVRRGWEALDADCEAAPGDEVVPLADRAAEQ